MALVLEALYEATADPAYRHGAETVVASWLAARTVLSGHPPLKVSDLAVDGGNLIRMGLKPGPSFGRILDSLLSWVLEDPSRNQEPALEDRVQEILGRGEPRE